MARHLTSIHKPYIECVFAQSIDGRLGMMPAESTRERLARGFTSRTDVDHLKQLLAKNDAVFIGAKSLFVERGALRVASLREDGSEPAWVIFSQTGDLEPQHGFWRQAGIRKMVCTVGDDPQLPAGDLFEGSFDVEGESVTSLFGSLTAILNHFHDSGFRKIALLGGGLLNGLFLRNGLVDRLHVTMVPWVIGGQEAPLSIASPVPIHARATLTSSEMADGFVFLTYEFAGVAPLP